MLNIGERNPHDKVQCQNLRWTCRMFDFSQQLTCTLAGLFPPPVRNRSSVGPTPNLFQIMYGLLLLFFIHSCPTLIFSRINHVVVVIFSVKNIKGFEILHAIKIFSQKDNVIFEIILNMPFVFICS